MGISRLIIGVIFAAITFVGHAADKVHEGIYYGPEKATSYQKSQCKLDIHVPEKKSRACPVVVFFHGGGLYKGTRGGPVMTKAGVILVAPSYRLNPKVKCPAYLDDAADALAWTFKNIATYGGDPKKIFVSGLSAGCYLATMLAMDKSWLAARGVDADDLGGLVAVSGQMITHFTIRKERGLKAQDGLCDKFAPMRHIRKTGFPILIQCGNDDYPSRQEENRLFASMMIRYAKQPTNAIAYREYPGTHYNFFSAVPKKDMEQFVLEKSGVVKNSGRFDKPLEEPKIDLRIYARKHGNKTYVDLESNITGFDAIEAQLPKAGKVSIDPEDGTAVLSNDIANGTADVRLSRKVPFKVVGTLGKFDLKKGKGAAVTSKMKRGSTLKFWTEDKYLMIQVNAKDPAVLGSHTNDLLSGDAVEICIDRTPYLCLGQNHYPIEGKDGEVRQYIFGASPASDGTTMAVRRNHIPCETGAKMKVDVAAGGYTLTARIPLDEITPLAKPDGVIGISVQRCLKDKTRRGRQNREYWTFGNSAQSRRLQYSIFTIEAF